MTRVTSSLTADGEPLEARDKVEDYAIANLEMANGANVRIACSWRLHAGCDAQISAAFYGTQGGARPAFIADLMGRLNTLERLSNARELRTFAC